MKTPAKIPVAVPHPSQAREPPARLAVESQEQENCRALASGLSASVQRLQLML